MSRLYIKHKSDIRGGSGNCANTKASAGIYWGSRGESKLCATIDVDWPKGAELPTMSIIFGKDIKISHAEVKI